MKKSETQKQPNNRRNNGKNANFISVRWRFITPLFIVVLLVAMIGTYILARNISGGLEVSQTNVLLQSSRSVADRANQLYDYHRQEAQREAPQAQGSAIGGVARQTEVPLTMVC